ncbi:DUF317 domain-containing protein [Streptomyces sp. NPDC058739]|uniref:DUF317 domain-containing protein n=1 Tax=Streptomyces sp. NPDC058739 TaxID=3346618 RepID=UPI0036A4D4D1
MEDRHWLSSDHCATPVLELLHALDWTVVDTPECNVHATSPDGRVDVGRLPEDPATWTLGIVWWVQVQPAEGGAWVQEFGIDTPSEWPDSSPPSSPTLLAESVSGTTPPARPAHRHRSGPRPSGPTSPVPLTGPTGGFDRTHAPGHPSRLPP